MGATLVTGARGFVGAWLARALLERGREVISLDRPRADRPVSTMELIGIEGEVADLEADCSIASRSSGRWTRTGWTRSSTWPPSRSSAPSRRRRCTGSRPTSAGTWTLLHACLAAEVGRVVVASSDKAYGAHDELPYREDFALQPTAPYEASKAAADVIARSYWPSYGLPVAVTRFANIYGGGDLNFSRIVPEAVCAALDGRAPVLRSDGSPERDFLYVEDAASAYLAIADTLDRDEVRGEAFNAGGGRPHRIGDVVAKIAELAGTGVEPDVRGSGNPEGEIDRQYVDATKIREVCGWEPAVDLDARAAAGDRLVPRAPAGATRTLNPGRAAAVGYRMQLATTVSCHGFPAEPSDGDSLQPRPGIDGVAALLAGDPVARVEIGDEATPDHHVAGITRRRGFLLTVRVVGRERGPRVDPRRDRVACELRARHATVGRRMPRRRAGWRRCRPPSASCQRPCEAEPVTVSLAMSLPKT